MRKIPSRRLRYVEGGIALGNETKQYRFFWGDKRRICTSNGDAATVVLELGGCFHLPARRELQCVFRGQKRNPAIRLLKVDAPLCFYFSLHLPHISEGQIASGHVIGSQCENLVKDGVDRSTVVR